MILPDRTGQVWERVTGDHFDAVWVVLGPPEGDGHPCGTLTDGSQGNRVEDCGPDSAQTFWEDCRWLRRLA